MSWLCTKKSGWEKYIIEVNVFLVRLRGRYLPPLLNSASILVRLLPRSSFSMKKKRQKVIQGDTPWKTPTGSKRYCGVASLHWALWQGKRNGADLLLAPDDAATAFQAVVVRNSPQSQSCDPDFTLYNAKVCAGIVTLLIAFIIIR